MVGAIPFCALGLMIGSLVKGSAAPGYANLIYLPGCYLSGMFFPMPQSMHWQAPIWPQFHVNAAGHACRRHHQVPVRSLQMAIAALVGYTVLFARVAIWRLARKG